MAAVAYTMTRKSVPAAATWPSTIPAVAFALRRLITPRTMAVTPHASDTRRNVVGVRVRKKAMRSESAATMPNTSAAVL